MQMKTMNSDSFLKCIAFYSEKVNKLHFSQDACQDASFLLYKKAPWVHLSLHKNVT